MTKILAVLALIPIIATALPLLRISHWWIRIFDFPRAQIAVIGTVILGLIWAFGTPQHFAGLFISGLLVLSVAWQLASMFPYTVLARKQVLPAKSPTDDTRLGLLVANVLMSNRNVAGLMEVVRKYNPDLILTVEPDEWWEKALRELEADYPHTLKNPLDTTFGMLVHSRLELINPEIRHILSERVPSMHMRLALRSGEQVSMHFVHPDPPNPQYATQTAERDAELLILGRELDQRDMPAIVAGDFNDVAWSSTTSLFQKASGLLDPRIGRGMYNSFNALNPLLRWPLDHVFHSDHFKLIRLEKGPAWGSDHFPIYIELSLEPGAKAVQDEPDSDQAEAERVDEKIAEGRVQAGI